MIQNHNVQLIFMNLKILSKMTNLKSQQKNAITFLWVATQEHVTATVQ